MVNPKSSLMPILPTNRLILREFTLSDAARVQLLAGEFEIADTTLTIPHPYEDGMAEEWISTHASKFAENKGMTLAVSLKNEGLLIGAITLTKINFVHQHAEMGYWIGKEYWNNGYCTAAAAKILEFGFSNYGLHRIYAHHLTRNPASGRVMQKIGMKHEGTLREAVIRWGKFEDVEVYAVLQPECRN